MRSQGATGLKEMLVGSNTEKVVRQSHIPVLVIKQDVDNFKIKNIIFASDFGELSRTTFQKVIDFANIFKATLHLLFINTVRNFETTSTVEAKFENFLRGFEIGKHTTTIFNDVTIEEGILNYGRRIEADIIAINTHGRSGLYNLFTESISKDLANHALRPVLTVKV